MKMSTHEEIFNKIIKDEYLKEKTIEQQLVKLMVKI